MHRRRVLRAGVALSLPAVAGCNRDADAPSTTDPLPGTESPAPARRWRTRLRTPPVDAPLLAGGSVVAVTERPGDDPVPERDAYAELLGFDAADGTAAWSFAAGDDNAKTWRQGDTVVAAWHDGVAAVGPDGTDRWRRPGGGFHALFDHGSTYLATDAGVVAVDPATGAERWRVLGAEGLVPAATSGSALYVRGFANGGDPRRGLHAVSPDDGTLRWSTPVGPRRNNAVLHADDTLVVGGYPRPVSVDAGASYPDHPTVEGVAADTGAVRWRFTPDADLALPRRAAGGVVLAKSWTYAEPNGGPDVRTSTLHGLALADGAERWRLESTVERTPLGPERFESASVATEVVGAGAAYVRTADGVVTARDVADGSERWRFDPREAARESDVAVADHQPDLAFDGGEVLVTYGDRLAALDPESGRRRWEFRADDQLSRFWTVADDAVALTTESSLQVVERG